MLRRLFAYYRAYHQPGPLLLHYMCVFGLVAFPLLYATRFLKAAPGFDDLGLRLFDMALLLALLVRNRLWPAWLKPYYLHISYVVMTIELPFTFVLTSLKNDGGPAAVGNTFFAVFLLLLLADWRNMIVMLVAGIGGAVLAYAATEVAPVFPMDYIGRAPVLLIGVAAGSVFKYALEQATAERVRQAYASLAGSIAHEMRNPMAQVRHSLENIRHALPVPSLHAQSQLVEGRQVDQLYRHVAQGEMAVRRGLQVIAMTLDEVNAKPPPQTLGFLWAAQVCRKAVEEYGYETEEQRAKIGIVVQQDFVFRGEETAFLFVLFNLLKNALYYLPAYPEARLQLIVADREIHVRDTGPGIAPERLPRLFEPFGSIGKSGGTGLGLAYCRRVVRGMGGDIRCESVVGHYTDFIMSFPAVSPQELEARRDAVVSAARALFQDRKLLLVDDDAMVRAATREKLRPLGCRLDEAADGVEAMQALRACAYDLVLLDLNMPRMNGYELAEWVRAGAGAANPKACLVAHTSEPAHLARVKTENAGIDSFVAKPSEDVTLLQAISRAFEERQERRSREAGWLAGRRLLLADDNAYNRMAVGVYLKHSGAQVVEVGSGEAVLEALACSGAFDAVLLDLHMPGMGGVESARAIRTLESPQREVPILAITAYASAELMAAAQAAGVGDFMLKPVEPEVLYRKLAALMGVSAPATTTSAAALPEPAGEPLLDEKRLQGYLRLGLLRDLADEFMIGIDRLGARVRDAVEAHDLQSTLDALHSLVGMAGEAGAQALHRRSRELYVPMLETQAWPANDDWVEELRILGQASNRALREFIATHLQAEA